MCSVEVQSVWGGLHGIIADVEGKARRPQVLRLCKLGSGSQHIFVDTTERFLFVSISLTRCASKIEKPTDFYPAMYVFRGSDS